MLPPVIPWSISLMNGGTADRLAGEDLVEHHGAEAADAAGRTRRCRQRAPGMKSASLASDVPPGAVARNRIWSSLSVVGFSTTVAPFESVHSVMPASGRAVVLTIEPRVRRRVHQRLAGGGVDVRFELLRRCAALTTAASCACRAATTPAPSGAETTTRRLPLGEPVAASALISLSVISG